MAVQSVDMNEGEVLKQLLADYLEWLLLGERRRLTVAGLVIAGVMILVASVVEYLFLARVVAGSDSNPFVWLRRMFRLHAFWESTLPPELWVYGYLLVIMLAGVYAYFNTGYLVSVLLGISPNIGTALWLIHGLDAYMDLSPSWCSSAFSRRGHSSPHLASSSATASG